MRMLYDRVLVERIEEKHNGVLIVPDVAKEKSMRGKILAVGPGKYRDGEFYPTEVEVGQVVIFNSKWDDMDGKLGNKQVIQEADIICIVEN